MGVKKAHFEILRTSNKHPKRLSSQICTVQNTAKFEENGHKVRIKSNRDHCFVLWLPLGRTREGCSDIPKRLLREKPKRIKDQEGGWVMKLQGYSECTWLVLFPELIHFVPVTKNSSQSECGRNQFDLLLLCFPSHHRSVLFQVWNLSALSFFAWSQIDLAKRKHNTSTTIRSCHRWSLCLRIKEFWQGKSD